MWELVSSAWAAMANSNNRKVAPIAAFFILPFSLMWKCMKCMEMMDL
jgi:hypothetical protein